MTSTDLREYFPSTASIIYRDKSGNSKTRYIFDGNPVGFHSLYDSLFSLNKPGEIYTWRKDYWRNEGWCTSTYAVLFMGDDKSVTEVGDWKAVSGCVPNVAFGYKTELTNGANIGLVWSPPDGVSGDASTAEMFTAAQVSPGTAYLTNGYSCYSRVGIIERLESFSPKYGRDENGNWAQGAAKIYSDVVRIIMYHGSKAPGANPQKIRCGLTQPISANGPYYQSFKDYNSYAIELWMAKGVGVIQENTPFIEDGSYWAIPNCGGQIFDPIEDRWYIYIDDLRP